MSSSELRLVTEQDAVVNSKDIVVLEQKGQLSFEFDKAIVRRITIVAMDEVHGKQLHLILNDLRPNVVIDLRYSVRFDIPGSSRTMFFIELERIQANYLRVPVEWHLLAPRPIDVSNHDIPHRLHFEVVERKR